MPGGTDVLRHCVVVTCFLLLTSITGLESTALAGTFAVRPPENFVRTNGAPVTVTRTFTVLDPSTTFTIRIDNGGVNGQFERVSSAAITLNGVEIARPNDFNQQVSVIERPVALTSNNTFSVELRSSTGSGITIQFIGVDNTPPTITASLNKPANAAGWHNSDVVVTFSCSDLTSGVATCPPPVTVSVDVANRMISGTAIDAAGNTAIATVTINLDKTPPSIAIMSPVPGSTVNGTTVPIRVGYMDALSGIDVSAYGSKIDGVDYSSFFMAGPSEASYTASLSPGSHGLEAVIKDKAGNAAQATAQFTIAGTTTVFRALPEAIPTSGQIPLTVRFITKGEYSAGAILRYRWDFEGDGTFDTSDPGARDYTRTFTTPGIRNAVLEILNDKNQTASATVQINVTGKPPIPTASVNPSNGAVPLTVTFTGSAVAGGAPITKYEWDFNGDGTFEYNSSTTGNTTFTYTSEGTFNAVFRVTDSAGLTGIAVVTATAIRVGPPGSPTATITGPATPQSRTAPASISFTGTGIDPDGTIAKYEWDFNGDGTYDFSSTSSGATSFTYNSPGTFTAAFRVTDNDGKTGVDTVDITITIFATLTISTDTLRPPGTVNVNTTLGGSAPVTVFLRNKAGQTVRTLVNNVTRNAGSYSDTWNGMDDNGAVVPEGEYFAILRYLANGVPVFVDPTTTTGNQFYNPGWSLATTKGGSCFNCPFAPYDNNFLQATFTLSQASEVTVSIRGFNTVNEVALLFDRKPFGRGATYTVVWEGTNAAGQLVHPSLYGDSQFIFGMTAYTLPSNGIFVETAPSISNVSVTPNYYDPFTGDFLSPQKPTANVSYALSKTSTVQLQVYRVGTNTLVRTIDIPNAAAGNGAVGWDGKNDNGILVDKGDYRLAVKAIDSAGNQSLVRYALMKVFY